jgi:hypothetical protein
LYREALMASNAISPRSPSSSTGRVQIKTKVLKRILEATGWKPEEELTLRAFFTANANPTTNHLPFSTFAQLFVAIGVEETYTPHFFRAMYKRHQDELGDILQQTSPLQQAQQATLHAQQSHLAVERRKPTEPGLTYKQFLLGVCAMDPAVPHGGAWGRERCKYIFIVYDLDDDNGLSFIEFTNMVRHIRRARGDSTRPEDVEKEAIATAQRFCDDVCRSTMVQTCSALTANDGRSVLLLLMQRNYHCLCYANRKPRRISCHQRISSMLWINSASAEPPSCFVCRYRSSSIRPFYNMQNWVRVPLLHLHRASRN